MPINQYHWMVNDAKFYCIGIRNYFHFRMPNSGFGGLNCYYCWIIGSGIGNECSHCTLMPRIMTRIAKANFKVPNLFLSLILCIIFSKFFLFLPFDCWLPNLWLTIANVIYWFQLKNKQKRTKYQSNLWSKLPFQTNWPSII